MEANITRVDVGIRITAATVCIMSVALNPFVPVWFSLIGAYLVLTCIPAWDPIYAAGSAVAAKLAGDGRRRAVRDTVAGVGS